MIEEFRPIAGFVGYRVSNHGRVQSCRTPRGQLSEQWHDIKPHRVGKGGHLQVVIVRDRRQFGRLVSRLVLEAFVGPCPPGMEACHGPDHDTTNCRIDNLRWDTHAANMADMVQAGRSAKAERANLAKFSDALIADARALKGQGATCREIERRLGISHSYVSRLTRGTRRVA
jgi:hypothetical protein